MKKLNKVIALVLCAVMLLSCAAFAAPEEPQGTYKEYTALGDSVVRGWGCNENYGHFGETEGDGCMDAFYPEIAADMLGIAEENRHFITLPGCRTKDAYYMLTGDTSLADEFTKSYQVFERLESMLKTTGNENYIRDSIKSSDMISIQVGSNDISVNVALKSGLFAAEEELSTTDAVAKIVKALWDSYGDFIKYFNLVLNEIESIKGDDPDYKVFIVGTYNPLMNCPLDDDMFLPVGTAIATLTALENEFMKHFAEEHEHAVFVDVSNTETHPIAEELSIMNFIKNINNMNYYTHPTEAGYNYIARQLVNAAVNGNDSYNIRIDLGAEKQVVSVTVNNRPVWGYSYEDHVLTIPYYNAGAVNVNVVTKESSGTIGAYSYQLVYSEAAGYTPYEIVGTVNFVNKTLTALRSVLTRCFSLLQSIFSAFTK